MNACRQRRARPLHRAPPSRSVSWPRPAARQPSRGGADPTIGATPPPTTGYGSAQDFATLKSAVAMGVSAWDIGVAEYQNVNFGLMRVMIPIINGTMPKGAVFHFPLSNDGTWDASTISQYKTYVQDKIFTPAGVANASFAPTAGPRALAYKGPYALNQEGGWNSGDLSKIAGGAAWRLSTKELLNVMNHVRRMNSIIPAAKAQYMLDNRFGIDAKISTTAGTIYWKNGLLRNDTPETSKTEQAVAVFLPNGMELAIFVNSPIGKAGTGSLANIVTNAFTASLH